MKLPFSLGVSSMVHAVVLGAAFAWTVDVQLEPEISGWQEVELRPVRFETIEIPEPRPLEVAAAPEVSPDPPTEPPADVAPPEPPKPKKPKKKRKKKPPPEPPAAQEIAPVVVEKTKEAAPAVVAPTKDVVAPKAIEPTFVSAVPKAAAPKVPEAVGGTSTQATGAAPGPSTGELRGMRRGYLRGLYKFVNQNKRYPRIARRGRKQGRVVLAVTIDAAGKILEVRVHKSSGHGVLDRSAAETIRALKRFPRPPRALGWSRRTIKVPMHYKLRR